MFVTVSIPKSTLVNFLQTAKDVFRIEANAILELSERLDGAYEKAVELILRTSGRVVICGMGKSGLVGRKIAATLASTGTPSFFMHPGEAFHGDLGMVTHDDVFIALSNSGETEELIKLIPFLRDNGNHIIALTGAMESSLAKASHVVLNTGVAQEACPLQLAPTSSTTATMAMGDALAVTLMQARNFREEQFARFHPGGSLGRRLLSTVQDNMITENLPCVDGTTCFADLVNCISSGLLGIAVVTHNNQLGIVTDGDIRRAFTEYQKDVFDLTAHQLMSNTPKSISPIAKMADAIRLMEQHRITSLLVMDNHKLVGIVKK